MAAPAAAARNTSRREVVMRGSTILPVLARHGAQIPLLLVERAPGRDILRIAADLVLAVDDGTTTFDRIGDDARVDGIAIPRPRAGVEDHAVLHLARRQQLHALRQCRLADADDLGRCR